MTNKACKWHKKTARHHCASWQKNVHEILLPKSQIWIWPEPLNVTTPEWKIQGTEEHSEWYMEGQLVKCGLEDTPQDRWCPFFYTSTSRKMERMRFPLFLLLSKTKILGCCICNKHKKTLKGKKKTGWMGTWEPEEQHSGEFSGFSVSKIPDLGLKML